MDAHKLSPDYKPGMRFQRSLSDPAEFTLTFELVPNRGGRSREQSRILTLAREIAADGRIQAISITENAGGHPALSPEVLGVDIQAMGLDVISHFSCKDKNRNQMESLLYAWDREGLRNLLVITGDYPKKGYRGHPKPVFDLDSVQALDLISRMNRGRGDDEHDCAVTFPTAFFKGVALSPFKLQESELMTQYFKLHRKIAAGADFVITQVGFDLRKFQEVLLYLKGQNLNIPVLGNVFIPNVRVLEMMYRGEVPGCVIPTALYEEMQQESCGADKGKKARLLRAAKLLAALQGLGYAGAHIGGPGLSFADLDYVMTQAQTLLSDWRSFIPELSNWPPHVFSLFDMDQDTGLNRPTPRALKARKKIFWHYECSDLMHRLVFAPDGLFFQAMEELCLGLDDTRLGRLLAVGEHLFKFIAFGCRNCGDCTLAELAFLCPQSGCAKNLLNGPCGGSRDGWCEVFPGKRGCLFVQVYERLKSRLRQEGLRQGFTPPRDWSLHETSSWLNFYSGRDHAGRKA